MKTVIATAAFSLLAAVALIAAASDAIAWDQLNTTPAWIGGSAARSAPPKYPLPSYAPKYAPQPKPTFAPRPQLNCTTTHYGITSSTTCR